MDFFDHQEQARRSTVWLVVLFALAVIGIVAVVYLALAGALGALDAEPGPEIGFWNPGLLAATAGGVFLLVAIASSIRTLSLRQGGSAIASMLGGRLVLPDTRDPDERRLINVVEEMSLASGFPVPQIYVLEEEAGINAFAAGLDHEDAVVAVTSGCLRLLTREELQGVVAHEYSHLLNADSRLNIRLTGLLFGILAIGLAGRILLRASWYIRGGRRNQAQIVAAVLGLVLLLTGYLGVFFGRLIRAAVSRQREYLADASAAQFTRNPYALAGALKKIGGHPVRGEMRNASAEEVSHFFFASSMSGGFVSNLWSTHPPLTDRIRRLDPSFDGDFSKHLPEPVTRRPAPETGAGRQSGMERLAPAMLAAMAGHVALDATRVDIPDALHRAISDPAGAHAAVIALVLDADPVARQPQLEKLQTELSEGQFDAVKRILPAIEVLPRRARLPLADLAMPALRQLSIEQSVAYCKLIDELVRLDRQLSVFEFALAATVRHRLAASAGMRPAPRRTTLDAVMPDALVLLSALAHVGGGSPAEVREAFEAGLAQLTDTWFSPVACTSREVEEALDRLAGTPAGLRRQIVEACARTVLHDPEFTDDEAELLRAVIAALDVPMPPFMPVASRSAETAGV
jgi:Zn-dependent protease with chaperone function